MLAFVRNFRPTGLGLAVAVVFLGAAVVGIFASGTTQKAGWAVFVLGLVFVVGGVPNSRGGGTRLMTSTRRGRIVDPPEPAVLDETPPDPDAWRRERERRELDGRS